MALNFYVNFSLQNFLSADLPIDCEQHFPNLDELWRRLVIVTAFSENHVSEAKGMIASVQKHMPGKRIIVYDLGIKPTARSQVWMQLNTFHGWA